jgi:cell wall-associated NlpC family hydrolase
VQSQRSGLFPEIGSHKEQSAMADTQTSTIAVRRHFVALARQQIGCHYLWGAAGARPGQQDGAYYRKGSVFMHENDTSGNSRDNGRTKPILHAACCRVDGYKVCAGRCDNQIVRVLREGDPANVVHNNTANQFVWTRPDGVINSSKTVKGQGCEGIRHFDCIGFVNWLFSEVVTHAHRSIPQWQQAGRDVGLRDVWAGDILTKPGHIGIAADATSAVHASGTRVGVIESPLSGSGWTGCYRMSEQYWLQGAAHVAAEEAAFLESMLGSP